jgi:hypothetical protein
MQKRRHILLDAGIEQLLDDVIAAEFGDVARQHLPDVVGEFEEVRRHGVTYGGKLRLCSVTPGFIR